MSQHTARWRHGLLVGLVTIVGLAASACAGGDAGGEKAASPKTAPVVDAALVAEGKGIATSAGCAACHSTNGSAGVGPTWKGLYRHSVALADGTSVTADDAYIAESIKDPNAKVVKGFAKDTMPATIGSTLKDSDIKALTEYIKSLP